MQDDLQDRLANMEKQYAELSAKYEGSDKAMWPPIKVELIRRIDALKAQINKAA